MEKKILRKKIIVMSDKFVLLSADFGQPLIKKNFFTIPVNC